MTAPMASREYFAAAGSPFSNEAAAVIGPQIEAMAEEGILDTKDEDAAAERLVEVARSTNHPLHSGCGFIWDDAEAARLQRIGHAKQMLRSIRVRFVQDDRPRTAAAYRVSREPAKASVFAAGHNVLRGDSAVAARKAREAFEELTSWRARYLPFVMVWADFAKVFRSVANQISEGEDLVRPAGLEDRTDGALSDMMAIQDLCLAWRDNHVATADIWGALAEQAVFMGEAIDAAVAVFGAGKPMQRQCLKCRRMFESSGLSNRLCERCSVISVPAQARIG